MKHALLIGIAAIVPIFFILLAVSSAYHRRKSRRKLKSGESIRSGLTRPEN